ALTVEALVADVGIVDSLLVARDDRSACLQHGGEAVGDHLVLVIARGPNDGKASKRYRGANDKRACNTHCPSAHRDLLCLDHLVLPPRVEINEMAKMCSGDRAAILDCDAR